MPTPSPRSAEGRRPTRAATLRQEEPPTTDAESAAAAARTASTAPVSDPEPPAVTLDAAVADWSQDTLRAQFAWGIGLLTAWVGGAKAVREAQRDAADRCEQACLRAGEQLQSARDWSQAASVHGDLIRAQSEEALRLWTELQQASASALAQTFERAVAGWSETSQASLAGLSRWVQVQASMPTSPEVIEAEAEHLTNPLAAGAIGWPAQEAMRQGMNIASSLWNDWMDWSQKNIPTRPGVSVH